MDGARIARGALAGLLASIVIALLIFIGESIIGYPHGIFYTVLSDALSIGDAKTLIGLLLHLTTGTLIGAIASIPLIRLLKMSIERFMLYGIIIGVVTWATLFLPISYMVIIPFLDVNEYELLDKSGSMVTSIDLKEQFNRIVYSSIGFHIQYGIIYSIIFFVMNRRYRFMIEEEKL